MLHVSVRCDGPTLTLTITDAQLHPRHASDAFVYVAEARRPEASAPPPASSYSSSSSSSAHALSSAAAPRHSAIVQGRGGRGLPKASGWALAVDRWLAQVDLTAVGIGLSLVAAIDTLFANRQSDGRGVLPGSFVPFARLACVVVRGGRRGQGYSVCHCGENFSRCQLYTSVSISGHRVRPAGPGP